MSSEAAALEEWLTAYNRNVGIEFERFAARRYSRTALAERDASAAADGARQWHQSFGPMQLVGAPSVAPGEAEAVVYAAGVDACARLWVEADAVEKDKIGAVYLSPFEAVECGERVPRVRDIDEFARRTREYLDELARGERFSGVLLVTRGGRRLVSEARGAARANPATPNGLETPFELASIAKVFTAVAIARLVEQGRLSYDATIGDVIPAFPGSADVRRITVRQLLSHTAGLSDYYRNGEIFKDDRRRAHLSEYWPLFAFHALEFEPGAKYSYSNSNYVVLGSIVEAASGSDFSGFVQREVLDRANMSSSCYCDPRDGRFAQPRSRYTALAGPARRPLREGWTAVPFDQPRPAISAGYAVSTAPDLARFGDALLDGRVIGGGALDEMRRPVAAMGDGGSIGLGFFLYDIGGVETLEHSGSSWGVRTQLALYPSLDIIVVILANSDSSGTQALHYKTRKWLSSLGSTP